MDFPPAVKRSLDESEKVRKTLEQEINEADATVINRTIEEALASGVDIYNSGNHLGCFRIYGGAAYKILFTLSNRSATATDVLTTALHKSDGVDNNADNRRGSFESVVGPNKNEVP